MRPPVNDRKPVVWAIGGSDSGGGAGIQADLATLRDFGVHPCTILTTVTAQNTVAMIDAAPVTAAMVCAQLEALASDLPPVAIKIGAMGSIDNAAVIVDFLERRDAFVVWDPVRHATVGGDLTPALGDELLDRMLRRADVVTPNADEAAHVVRAGDDLAAIARALVERGARAVLLKGGHTGEPAVDVWHTRMRSVWLEGPHLHGHAGHGGGCTLAAAIAAAHALGYGHDELPVIAKAYLTAGLRRPDVVGAGRAPVGHWGWPLDLRDLPAVHARRPWLRTQFPALERKLGLYVIADSADGVQRLVALGIPTIQLRIKSASETTLRAQIEASIAATRGSACRVIVNDHWQLAIEYGAYGVHLGQEDFDTADLERIAAAGIRLGVSCHDEYEIARANALRPSYIALGPIFATQSKSVGFAPRGPARLARWVRLLGSRYPTVAIGGIDLDTIDSVLTTGVDTVCVIRAVTAAADPAQAAAALMAAIESRSGHRGAPTEA
jgi:hydroxymethylpyrimidine kinase / phosphomethylpyrimidine kinase / thiamine-phosphate diphosphorylase